MTTHISKVKIMYSIKQSLAQTLDNMYKFLEMHNRIKNKLRKKRRLKPLAAFA